MMMNGSNSIPHADDIRNAYDAAKPAARVTLLRELQQALPKQPALADGATNLAIAVLGSREHHTNREPAAVIGALTMVSTIAEVTRTVSKRLVHPVIEAGLFSSDERIQEVAQSTIANLVKADEKLRGRVLADISHYQPTDFGHRADGMIQAVEAVPSPIPAGPTPWKEPLPKPAIERMDGRPNVDIVTKRLNEIARMPKPAPALPRTKSAPGRTM